MYGTTTSEICHCLAGYTRITSNPIIHKTGYKALVLQLKQEMPFWTSKNLSQQALMCKGSSEGRTHSFDMKNKKNNI